MSLINDALRRASQTERERPRQAAPPMGMEPAPAARASRLSVVLVGVVLATLLMAGWFFWQWWNVRGNPGGALVAASIAPPVTPRVIPPPVAATQPVPAAPAAPVNIAPAPVVIATPAVAAPPVAAPPVVAPPAVAPTAPPGVARDNQTAWPVQMTLTAVFFNKTNPRAIINGNLYGVGDEIQGVVLKKIDRNEVTVEWNGHSKILMMGGQ